MAEKENFESLLKELETITKALEEKDLSLDDALAKYQRGLELSKKCYEMLEKAQTLIVKESE